MRTKLYFQSALVVIILLLLFSTGGAAPRGSTQVFQYGTEPNTPGREERLKPRPPTSKPEKTQVTHQFLTNVVAVKFRDGLKLRARDGNLQEFGPGKLLHADNFLPASARGRWERVDSIPEERIDELRAKAQRKLGQAIADLNLQFHLFLSNGTDAARVCDELNQLDIVELAQLIPRATTPSTPPKVQDYQGYLNESPAGVGASSAWTAYGARGAGIQLLDIEFSFNANHHDLPAVGIVLPPIQGTFSEHGTAVLGEIGAKDDGVGTTGIAPDCSLLFASVEGASIDSALMAAVDALSAGDVILIELQIGGPNEGAYVPVEWYKPYYDRILTAVGQGLIVVEAAGNGSQNLDAPIYSSGNNGHWPFLMENDSGAILVGAGDSPSSAVPRSRLGFSNYGATVDLQGWGVNVWTTGYGDYLAETNADYTSTFNGTSSASPIVAGACVLLQSVYKAKTGGVLSPRNLKEILRTSGSVQQGNIAENIGPLPNVMSAIATVIGPIPQLSSVSTSNGSLGVVLRGPFDQSYVIETSSNLHNWLPLSTNPIRAGGPSFVMNFGAMDQPLRFYRALPAFGNVGLHVFPGTISLPFINTNGWIQQNLQSGLSDGGRAVYYFTIPQAGSYVMNGIVSAPNGAANSFFINVDSEPQEPTMIWDIPITSGFAPRPVTWRGTGSDVSNQFSPKVFALTEGQHRVIIRGREANTLLQSLTIGSADSAPTLTLISQTPEDVDPTVTGTQVYATSTVQYSGSAADPNGNPLTWQWIYRVDGGEEIVLQSGNGVVPSLDFTYGMEAVGRSYLWILRVFNGQLIVQSEMNVYVEAPVVPPQGLSIPAPLGIINSPFIITNGYIYQPVQSTLGSGGRATYQFATPIVGTFMIEATVDAPNDAANSVFMNIDGEPDDPYMISDILPTTSGFEVRALSWRGNGTSINNQFAPQIFSLLPGTHQLIIRGREGNVRLQSIKIVLTGRG